MSGMNVQGLLDFLHERIDSGSLSPDADVELVASPESLTRAGLGLTGSDGGGGNELGREGESGSGLGVVVSKSDDTLRLVGPVDFSGFGGVIVRDHVVKALRDAAYAIDLTQFYQYGPRDSTIELSNAETTARVWLLHRADDIEEQRTQSL